MNYKLEKLTTQYRKFTENQALTAGQLNEIIDFFEDQDRLSRTRLTGVGLACGFKTSVLAGSDDTKIINVTQGVGVTTDGDLVTLRDKASGSIGVLGEKEVVIDITEKNYTHYREYETTKGFEESDYPFFKSVGDDGVEQKVKLYELRNEQELGTNTDFKKIDDGFLASNRTEKNEPKNWVALLFLESFEEGETPCEDIDCDNQGDEQVSNLRMLLVSEDDVDKISQSDIIYKTAESYEALHKVLNPIEAFRAIISEDVKNAGELKEKFADVVTETNVFGEEEGDLGLLAGIKKVIETFNLSINTTELSNRAEVLFKASNSFKGEDFQYRYDLLKDLFATYNEIRSFILQLKFQCSPDLNAFPKHLLLGVLGASLNIGENTEYRHDFYKSPILANDGENYKKLVFLINRFEKLLKNGLAINLPGTVKVTPSTTSVLLGNRAIPFYYNTSQDFIKNWNFDKTERNKEGYNLSYHTNNLKKEEFILEPLKYSLEGFNFLRIEGHIGRDYREVYKEIDSIRTQYGLPFKIKLISLNEVEDSNDGTEPNTSISEDISAAEKAMLSNDPLIQKEGAGILSALKNKLTRISGSTIIDSTSEEEIETELLSDYLDRNSGLEHLGGVEFGGTFVLVYYTDASSKSLVVADFSTPYICCRKKDPVLLAVPSETACEYEEPIQISVIPKDAEVTAFVKDQEINVITKQGEQNYFNPTLVPDEYLEKVITFQVNEEAVAPQITVYPQPEVTVTYKIKYIENKDEAIVTYNGLSTEYEYEFDFIGNGSWETIVPDANGNYSRTYLLTSDVINTRIRVTGANSCADEVVISQKVNRRPIIDDNTVDVTISPDYTVLPYAEVVNNYRDSDNDEVFEITFFSKTNNLDFNVQPSGGNATGVALNNPYTADPKPGFEVKYKSSLANPLYFPKNLYDSAGNISSEIIEIDKEAYEGLINDHSILTIDNEDVKNRKAIFQKIENTIEELPNDTIVYIHIDTSSLGGADINQIEAIAKEWWANFQVNNKDFGGSFLINTTNGRATGLRASINGSSIASGTVEAWLVNPTEGLQRQAYKEGITSFKSEQDFLTYIQSKSLVVLTFVDETHSEYHQSTPNAFNGEPTTKYVTDYQNFVNKIRPALKFFKGALYPITGITTTYDNAFLLHAMAAMKATVLSKSEIDGLMGDAKVKAYGENNMKTIFYDNLNTRNPYAAYPDLERNGWEGRFDKTAPVSGVLNSSEFATELNNILTDTSTVQITTPITEEVPINNLGVAVNSNFTLNVKDDNPLGSRESDKAQVDVNFVIPPEQYVPVLSGRTDIYETDFDASDDVPNSIPMSSFEISDNGIDRIKIEELTFLDSRIAFKVSALDINQENTPLVIDRASIENNQLLFTLKKDSEIPTGNIIQFKYRVAKVGQVNYSRVVNTLIVRIGEGGYGDNVVSDIIGRL